MRHRPSRFPLAVLAGSCVLVTAACGSGSSVGQSQPVVSPSPPGPLPPASTIAGAQPALAVDIVQGTQPTPVDIDVDGGDHGVSVTFRELTIEPRSGTGEHCHHGQLIAVVKKGALTHYADVYPGGAHIYRAGDSLVEGPGYRHEGRNEGTEDVVLLVTYVTPVGMPLAETDLTKCSE